MNKNPKLPKWCVLSVIPTANFELILLFADGSEKKFDFLQSKLNGPVYEKLKNLEFFMKAHICCYGVCWDECTDVSPEYLYTHSVASPTTTAVLD